MKASETRNYLVSVVNPILRPMVEQIAKERPENIMKFIADYAQGHLGRHLLMEVKVR